MTSTKLLKAAYAVLRVAKKQYGFIGHREAQILCAVGGEIAKTRLIVRCGARRFVSTPESLAWDIDYVKKIGDYVRDVSIHPDHVYPVEL